MVGCGSIGKRHLSNLKQLGASKLVAFDPREDRRLEVSERLGIPTFDDLAGALDEETEVALICTPTHLHIEHALAAARRGCHLFIEKPISDSLEGVGELLEEVGRRQLVTLVGCNYRFHPGLRHAKRLLHEKVVGKVISARAEFGQFLPDWHPWEDYKEGYSARRSLGGGVLLDRIHEIDYLRWLLGDVTEVAAMIGHASDLEIDTEDTADVLLRFNNGVFGSIHLDYVRRAYNSRLEITGDQGIIEWCYQDTSVRWYVAAEGCWHSMQWPRYDNNQMYLDEMRHFLTALAAEEVAELDVPGGIRDLAVALAAKEAMHHRRSVAIER